MLTGHGKLPHLGQVGVSLSGVVAHQDVIRLPRLEIIAGSDAERGTVDSERKLSGLREDVLERDADAGAGLDSEGALGSG